MEDYRRRELIKTLGLAAGLLIVPKLNAYSRELPYNAQIELPPFSFQETRIKGKLKGGKVLIVGGIHGNEPGAYKAAEILRQVKVKRGELIIAPRANPVSIFTNRRGYNGDMNRKFAYISKKDPDYNQVVSLKELVRRERPELLLTLHDGFGFHSVNKNCWGQCIVIDEVRYKNIELGKQASLVSKKVSSQIKKREWKIPVYNTHTFSKSTKHPEQRKSLTYFCLKECSVPAICLEVSKQLPDLYHKVKFHLMMVREFFRLHKVEIEPSIDYIIANLKEFLEPKVNYQALIEVNGRRVLVSSNRTFKVPKGSRVKFLSLHGTQGTGVITEDLNANLRNLKIKRKIAVDLKDDFKKVFTIRFEVV
ncbi:M99 family carboxypeptidase catalytic domain-containing protein [Thermovibrio sp.]